MLSSDLEAAERLQRQMGIRDSLGEDAMNEYITINLKGDWLLAVGDDELIKIHFHTNEPWQLLEYCSTLGDISDIVEENMERQEHGLQG